MLVPSRNRRSREPTVDFDLASASFPFIKRRGRQQLRRCPVLSNCLAVLTLRTNTDAGSSASHTQAVSVIFSPACSPLFLPSIWQVILTVGDRKVKTLDKAPYPGYIHTVRRWRRWRRMHSVRAVCVL